MIEVSARLLEQLLCCRIEVSVSILCVYIHDPDLSNPALAGERQIDGHAPAETAAFCFNQCWFVSQQQIADLLKHQHIYFLSGLTGGDLNLWGWLGSPKALIDPLYKFCGCLLAKSSHHSIR